MSVFGDRIDFDTKRLIINGKDFQAEIDDLDARVTVNETDINTIETRINTTQFVDSENLLGTYNRAKEDLTTSSITNFRYVSLGNNVDFSALPENKDVKLTFNCPCFINVEQPGSLDFSVINYQFQFRFAPTGTSNYTYLSIGTSDTYINMAGSNAFFVNPIRSTIFDFNRGTTTNWSVEIGCRWTLCPTDTQAGYDSNWHGKVLKDTNNAGGGSISSHTFFVSTNGTLTYTNFAIS